MLSLLGLIHPRQTRITLQTGNIAREYSGMTVRGEKPTVRFGALHPGHYIDLLRMPEHRDVGSYPNAPEYVILDETGADVTAQYAITEDFGTITITPRKIVLHTPDREKLYDGLPLEADEIAVWGTLVSGDSLIVYGVDSLTIPGQKPITPIYAILEKNGQDVTANYAITEHFGYLTVRAIPITISTDSKSAPYSGESISAPGWKQTKGQLLKGHRITVTNDTVLQDVGSIPNEAAVTVLDENGADVTHLYDIGFDLGILEIHPIPLTITTESAEKVYDGTELRCTKWKLTENALPEDAVVTVLSSASVTRVGTVDNAIQLRILDGTGKDITYRYDITTDYGTLTIRARSLTLKTGSAQKVFDNFPLECSEYEIIAGQLCDGDNMELIFTSIVEPGYSDNAVLSCIIYHVDAYGNKTDVTSCYRISYQYGKLQITTD